MQSTTQPQQKMKTKNMTTLHLGKSISRSPLRLAFLLMLACIGLSPAPKAFGVSPKPDGGYPGANTAEGDNALQNLTSGMDNTALGYRALFSNTDGVDNTANGYQALYHNTTGASNTAIGAGALTSNTTGFQNTAIGRQALFSNTTGSPNTAVGYQALFSNTDGVDNTANGYQALYHNTFGNFNEAIGVEALFSNTTGGNNTANGSLALSGNTTGSYNTANGNDALTGNTTGSFNIALGEGAGNNLTTGDNNIDIGNGGLAAEGNAIRIGALQTATFIAGIHGAAVTGSAVVVNSSGQLGVAPSSERFKDDIKPMDKASEAILALQPVTFRYNHELDPKGMPQFGLVAEEVEKVNRALVARDADGKPYTVRYEAVNAMLLNEFLKEHRKMQRLETIIAKQQKQIEALTTGLQKVSARLELSKSASQMAGND
jgi:hypothetical protein